MRAVVKIFFNGLKLLDKRAKRFLAIYTLYLTSLAAIDGIGLYLLASLLNAPEEGSVSSWQMTVTLVIGLFVLKSVLAITGIHRGLKEFAKIEVSLGQNNLKLLIDEPWISQRNSTSSDYFNSVDRGPKELVIGIFLSIGTVVAEVSSVVVILIVIFVAQPLTSLIILVYFGLATLIQHKLLARRAAEVGSAAVAQQNITYQVLQDISELSKILKVQSSASLESNLMRERENLAAARNATWFYSALPRYVLEGVLGLGFVLVAIFTYLINGSSSVFAAVAFFAIAGFRLLPSINRIQGILLNVISVTELAEYGLGSKVPQKNVKSKIESIRVDEEIVTKFEDVSFVFPDSNSEILSKISFTLIAGKQYAIVGHSGSGKTTLLDLLLGVLEPTSGRIVLSKSDFKVGFVPQDTSLFFGTIAQNVSMEWDDASIDFRRVANCLELVGLTNLHLIQNETYLDKDRVLNMSGGQKQRIGLARALYQEPQLLVLDEATSSLDGKTELEIIEKIERLRGQITVVMVAHRLSSLRNVDELLYLEDGSLTDMCSWDDLYANNLKFRRQVEIGRA
jgi:ATP-binding cassette, subfamily B, bacterial PglK